MPTIVITGASDGIGAAGARQLKARGHDVVLVGRNKAKTAALARELNAPFHTADYTQLSDVARLAAELGNHGRIDVLVNNAGGIMGPRELTADGFERTFQVNHLAGFLLTRLLLPRLVASRARVIQTASAAANMFGRSFDVTDLNNERNYTPLGAYGRSKLENILFTRELDRRHRADGIAAVAFHPGVVRTNFASETTPMMRLVYHSPLKYLLPLSPARSAQRLVRLAEGTPGADWQPGACYAGRTPMTVAFKDDGTAARLLWERSEVLLKPGLG
ncbi:Short-chain dehydrogenase/reductase SDR [Bradyrhizobium sp. ORS 375]|uniref:SDR family NAD(P)-dependent oxidoreductase n=1 Tax=Bradyrhizobium sp. (strain ORS 375) TaxID=566679 RepID=UPI00024064B2|nr:SDR family NAD(P)-dependent oxidoreductase [Bradyrhizobium sp. ORS 375]CCD95909.1 Short-chain dehydrogenase/reductase SDR [Bradyrhizobium sp. ORS 375]